MMPIMDGFEATRKIREAEKDRMEENAIPIIALTANSSKEDEQKCAEAGMNDFVPKPIRRDLLEKVIVKWILKSDKN
jgi:CheY-like chemotaxis protein